MPALADRLLTLKGAFGRPGNSDYLIGPQSCSAGTDLLRPCSKETPMPVLTQLEGTTITGTVDSPVVTLPPTSVLNDFGAGQSFDGYRVQDDETGPNTVTAGEFLTPIIDGEPLPGTYLGSGVLSTAAANIGQLSGALTNGVRLQVNPVDVDYFRDNDGNVYFISDQP